MLGLGPVHVTERVEGGFSVVRAKMGVFEGVVILTSLTREGGGCVRN